MATLLRGRQTRSERDWRGAGDAVNWQPTAGSGSRGSAARLVVRALLSSDDARTAATCYWSVKLTVTVMMIETGLPLSNVGVNTHCRTASSAALSSIGIERSTRASFTVPSGPDQHVEDHHALDPRVLRLLGVHRLDVHDPRRRLDVAADADGVLRPVRGRRGEHRPGRGSGIPRRHARRPVAEREVDGHGHQPALRAVPRRELPLQHRVHGCPDERPQGAKRADVEHVARTDR